MDRVKILLGNGIMTSEGDFWRRQRRMMQPCFHRRVIDRFSALDPRGQRASSPSAGPRRPRAASRSTSPTMPASSRWRSCCARYSAMISSALETPAGRESVRSRRQGTEPRSEVRVSLSLAHQAGGGADRTPAPRARGAVRFSEHADGGARPRQRPAAMSDKELIDEVLDADRRRPRDHRRGAHLDLVPHQPASGNGGAARGRSGPDDAGYAGSRRRRVARIHPSGGAGGAAALSARVAVHAPHPRGRRARRLSRAGAHRCVHQPLHAAPAPGVLERRRRNSGPSASPGSTPRSGIASPIFPFRSARATASARTWPCSKCWCT